MLFCCFFTQNWYWGISILFLDTKYTYLSCFFLLDLKKKETLILSYLSVWLIYTWRKVSWWNVSNNYSHQSIEQQFIYHPTFFNFTHVHVFLYVIQIKYVIFFKYFGSATFVFPYPFWGGFLFSFCLFSSHISVLAIFLNK